MNDTSPEMERIVAERYQRMTPDERMRIASSMFETARQIVESSLPANLTRKERRLAFARRLYAGELPRQHCWRSLNGLIDPLPVRNRHAHFKRTDCARGLCQRRAEALHRCTVSRALSGSIRITSAVALRSAWLERDSNSVRSRSLALTVRVRPRAAGSRRPSSPRSGPGDQMRSSKARYCARARLDRAPSAR